MKRWFAVVEGDEGEELWPEGLIVLETIEGEHEDIAHARARFLAATTKRPHRVMAIYEVKTYKEIFMELIDCLSIRIEEARAKLDGARARLKESTEAARSKAQSIKDSVWEQAHGDRTLPMADPLPPPPARGK